uniref:Cadherin domain-containing protein n=1 Tax=Amphilophus citrinellus TaxID=61819 RepID=A0A3Q0R702_AMPCI
KFNNKLNLLHFGVSRELFSPPQMQDLHRVMSKRRVSQDYKLNRLSNHYGYSFFLFCCTDGGLFVLFSYSMENLDVPFAIDETSGELFTTNVLDREAVAIYILEVTASDKHPNQPLATVRITVLDRNDNAPRFSRIFLTEVPEDAPVGQTIIQITATDDDTDANTVINYSIVDQSDDMLFNIDFNTGHITVEGVLDREVQDCYILKVSANDSAWSIGTEVTIVILDVNDNRPVFSEHLYSIILPETKDKEVFVVQILATDADIGKNSAIFYYALNGGNASDLFWIQNENQSITLLVMKWLCGKIPADQQFLKHSDQPERHLSSLF